MVQRRKAFTAIPIVAFVLACMFSGSRQIAAHPTTQSTLARRFAPVVRLHPDDQYRPASVEWYLRRVQMRFAVRGRSDRQILDKGRVTPASLTTQSFDSQQSGRGYPSEFFLQIPNNHEERRTRRGSLRDARCYSHTVSTRRGTEIQYWFFYPYSGNISHVGHFAHEGDWEHVTLRLIPGDSAVSEVFYAAHEGGAWHPARRVVNDAGRPVVYSARWSHASYPTAGTQARSDLPDDHTAAGPVWNCASALVELDAARPAWMRYTGRWGEHGLWYFTRGPRGPALHQAWDGEDNRRSGWMVFREGNRCSQDIIGETNHFRGQRINLRRTHGWENDEARSLQLDRVRAGTVIRIFDDPGGGRDDDYTVITVKSITNRYCIRTFERSWEDGTVRVQYRPDNGLDGKVSHVQVDRVPR